MIVAAVLIPVGGYRGRAGQTAGGAFLFFLLIIFFFVLAAGVWTRPYGPTVGGVFWAPFLFWAVVIGLILAAVGSSDKDVDRAGSRSIESTRPSDATPPPTPREGRVSERADLEDTTDTAVAASVFGVFFFGLIVVLLIGALVAIVD